MSKARIGIASFAFLLAGGLLVLCYARNSLLELPTRLSPPASGLKRAQYLTREGEPLTRTFVNSWNYQQRVNLHEIPHLLQAAVIRAEDKRFYRHTGSDYRAIFGAALEALRHGRIVRGGSSISEQVVRMLHPRERSLWSRLLELLEARHLEKRFSKGEILEFYLNQIPYARNRRGVSSAALDLFDRDLSTLSPKESLLLAVMIRAPSRLDPRRANTEALDWRIDSLLQALRKDSLISEEEYKLILSSEYQLSPTKLQLEAGRFVEYLERTHAQSQAAVEAYRRTSLDAELQRSVQALLSQRLREYEARGASAGAVLVAHNKTGEILSWASGRASAGAGDEQIDAVLARRQPGSTLKPFVYALAMEQGWTAATIIDDSPLARPVGVGLKQYRNFSGRHYGPVRLRIALGNSLNIPAIKTAQFVSPEAIYELYKRLGFYGLQRSVGHYGEGLALGNAEVSLFELVQAYLVLARGGASIPLSGVLNQSSSANSSPRVFSSTVASVVGDILSDGSARQLEFPGDGTLSFPFKTAVKTGTSSDYRDAWALGYNDSYTVGVWMGDLDYQAMREVTGSEGPAVLLRSVFAELNRRNPAPPPYLSPELRMLSVCESDGQAACGGCNAVLEFFVPGTEPKTCNTEEYTEAKLSDEERVPRIVSPTRGLHLALDPRIPDSLEKFPLVVDVGPTCSKVRWFINDQVVAETRESKFLWQLSKGEKVLRAEVWFEEGDMVDTSAIRFYVR